MHHHRILVAVHFHDPSILTARFIWIITW